MSRETQCGCSWGRVRLNTEFCGSIVSVGQGRAGREVRSKEHRPGRTDVRGTVVFVSDISWRVSSGERYLRCGRTFPRRLWNLEMGGRKRSGVRVCNTCAIILRMFNFSLDILGLAGEKGEEGTDGEGTFTTVEGFPPIRYAHVLGDGVASCRLSLMCQ